ncbi:Molybdopterin-guanine dinucleotide biosynthesis protein MobB [Cupriavidus necator]|uniref:DUF2889 domain-containing protein n=1 Tax=Cupriavidus necator TaxID=106590 RepID=UPI003F741149
METALTPQPGRTLRHTRQIECRGYLRDDGLYDIEADMDDISADATELPFVSVPDGGFIHRMRLCMTIGADLVIRRFEARTETGPTPYCAEINAAYRQLEGLRIGGGFRQQARARLGGAKGCTHLTELLGPLATTAMQTIMSVQREQSPWHAKLAGDEPVPRPWILDTCHAYRSDGEAVNVIWPLHRRASD